MTLGAGLGYARVMPRWKPGSRERLQAAALDLFSQQGFQNTTVSEITGRVGVTTRTFFRHFADKRDVLFAGADEFQQLLVQATVHAPSELSPLEAITAALVAFDWQTMAPYAAQRQAAITASPELMERELIKFDTLTAALADGLRRRGTDDSTASLAAQAGMTVFRTAYLRWAQADNHSDMDQIVNDVLAGLRAAVTARPETRRPLPSGWTTSA